MATQKEFHGTSKIRIVEYKNGPPVIEQCQSCSHATIRNFAPKGCPDLHVVKSQTVDCSLNQNAWQDKECGVFAEGTPETSDPLLQFYFTS